MICLTLEWVPVTGQAISPHRSYVRHLWWGGKTPMWDGVELSITPQLGFSELQHLVLNGTQ